MAVFKFLLAIIWISTLGLPNALAEIRVVASIKPVHSLVAAVMAGIGQPALISDGRSTPHANRLRPSSANALAKADVVFWIGPGLETYLEKPLRTIAAGAKLIELGRTPGLIKLLPRQGGNFENPARATANDASFDPHIWLDPQNARIMVDEISRTLAAVDPHNRNAYQANAVRLKRKLDQLINEVHQALAPVKSRPFFVYHDAFQYFESRFQLNIAGTLVTNPEISPGAGRISRIRRKIATLPGVCIFSEPQLQPRLIETLVRGTQAKQAVLDPLGADLDAGPDQYFKLIWTMAKSIRQCLSAQ